MSIIQYIHYLKNRRRFLEIASDLIDSYDPEHKDSIRTSCKKSLMLDLSEYVNHWKDDIAAWQDFDTDYIKIVHVALVNMIDTTLENHHRSHGISLSIGSEYDSYRAVLRKCLDWGVAHGELTEEERAAYRC